MSQYAELDRLVLARIGATHGAVLTYIFAREVRAETERIAIATGREGFRILDGRIQALRKAGKIVFKGEWRLAEDAP